MHLIADAITVLGSRHGLVLDPCHRQARVLRYETPDGGAPVAITAGFRCPERGEVVFPLCPDGTGFFFLDQRLTPTRSRLIGIDWQSGLKVKLEIATPFRPRDADFSTTPVLAIRMTVERLRGSFRWAWPNAAPARVELFLRVGGPGITVSPAGDDAIDLQFTSQVTRSSRWVDGKELAERDTLPQRDRLVAICGARRGTEIVLEADPTCGGELIAAWCTHGQDVLTINGEAQPFRYARRFADLPAVAEWARRGGAAEILANARTVDGIIQDNDCSRASNLLLAQTLHSWLTATWWVAGNRGEHLACREGSCGALSTVDVEFTQCPFYLAVWPELLALHLETWTLAQCDGTAVLGSRGAGTRFQHHDVGGPDATIGTCVYPHYMPVEETTNWLIMLYGYWRRSGDASLLHRHAGTVKSYLAFLHAADTDGDGVPDEGNANTIDDGSPAIQYGRSQIYLAVKTLGACAVGARLLAELGDDPAAATCLRQADAIRRTISEKGWNGDHFVVLLRPEAAGVKTAWEGKPAEGDAHGRIPGWDAPHIYTLNGQAPLDLVGLDLGLDQQRVRTDLEVATRRCLREYGCIHTDYAAKAEAGVAGWAGSSSDPGWLSMNMLRDIAAFYRGVDLRSLADRYWDWQATTNTAEVKLFFETFNGNNLCWYPRGLAVWGWFDALGGLVVDRVTGRCESTPRLPSVRVPRLIDADWRTGRHAVMTSIPS